MFVNSVLIRNIRSIGTLEWRRPFKGDYEGWHVILGDNASGKSSFLQSIALILSGPAEAPALRQDWNTWVRSGTDAAHVALTLDYHSGLDRWAKTGRQPTARYLSIFLHLKRAEGKISSDWRGTPTPKRHVWGGKGGWFSAAFGPFRRFTGGEADYTKLFYSHPRLARHLSVFGEDVALTECLEWLRQLKHEKLEQQQEGRGDNHLLDRIIEFVNVSELLPHGACIREVTAAGVRCVDANGFDLPVEQLSDGFRSILSLTFELIRQMERVYGATALFEAHNPARIVVPGVVLVDEIDVHLHPTWQRRIGLWFREHFPNVQFFVTTHSPLICQAAEVGTVFRLPTPGTDEKGRMITGDELNRLLYGSVADAYGTGVFGEGVARSAASQRHLQRLAELNQKELREALTGPEQSEQQSLRAMLPTTPHATPATREVAANGR